MKKVVIFLIAALCSTFLYAGTSIKSVEIAPGAKEYILNNGILEVRCIPEASGLISGFYSISDQRQMVESPEFTVVQDDLLPRRPILKRFGLRESARGVKMEYFIGYRVHGESANDGNAVLKLYSRAFFSHDISVNKTIVLPEGASKITVAFEMHSYRNSAPMIFWINGVTNMGGGLDTVLMPVHKNIASRGPFGLNTFPQEGVYFDNARLPQTVLTAPWKPWIGRVSGKGRPGVLVLVMRDSGETVNGGVMSSWKSSTGDLHTTEVYLPAKSMKKDEKWHIAYDYMYFANMKSLRDVAGNYGIDREGDTLFIATAVPVNAGTMQLKWSAGAAEIRIPALKPGDLFSVDLKKIMPDPALSLTGIMPGNIAFDVPQLIFPAK